MWNRGGCTTRNKLTLQRARRHQGRPRCSASCIHISGWRNAAQGNNKGPDHERHHKVILKRFKEWWVYLKMCSYHFYWDAFQKTKKKERKKMLTLLFKNSASAANDSCIVSCTTTLNWPLFKRFDSIFLLSLSAIQECIKENYCRAHLCIVLHCLSAAVTGLIYWGWGWGWGVLEGRTPKWLMLDRQELRCPVGFDKHPRCCMKQSGICLWQQTSALSAATNSGSFTMVPYGDWVGRSLHLKMKSQTF